MKYVDCGKYPDNYDFVSDAEKNEILDYLNSGSDWHEHLANEKKAYVADLETRGIYAEYNWIGHRDQWFLATSSDAEAEEDWRWQCAD